MNPGSQCNAVDFCIYNLKWWALDKTPAPWKLTEVKPAG
jgi:hypothetical protein